MTKTSRGLGAVALLLAFGCGGDDSTPAAQRSMEREKPAEAEAAAGNRAPVVERLTLAPRAPSISDEITADVRTSDPDGDDVTLRYAWTVNGRPAGKGSTLRAGSAGRDAEIELTVVAEDGVSESEPMTATTQIVAGVPVIAGITFDPPGGAKAGDVVTALVDVANEDDSQLAIEYRWLVNDQAVSEPSNRLSTAGLRKGDRVQVEVLARDGDQASALVRSLPLEIGNAPPKFKGIPSAVPDGDAFKYPFEAEDPDGDRSLRYSLDKGPAGMTIDPIAGVATWRPSKEQAGKQAIEVSVRDSAGATTTLRFSVEVTATETLPEGQGAQDPAAPPAKAAPAKAAPTFSDEPDAEAQAAAAPAKAAPAKAAEPTFSDEGE